MKTRMRAPGFYLYLLTAALVGLPATAEAQAPTPQIRVGVNLVTVDVIVTDRKGSYAPDLTAADFQVSEDGVRQKIEGFQKVFDAPAAASGDVAPPVAGSAPAPGDRRLFILLLDNLNSRRTHLTQAAQAVQAFISERLLPQDLMAILTISGALRLTQNFTADRGSLLESLQRAMRGPAEGESAQGEIGRRSATAQQQADIAAQTGSPLDRIQAQQALYDAVVYQTSYNDYSAQNSMVVLKAVCDALRPLAGRKAVVLVSEGFAPTRTAQAGLLRAVDAANKSNVSVYTLNPRGLDIKDATQVGARLNPMGTNPLNSQREVVAGNSVFDMIPYDNRGNSDEDGLDELSLSTGGLAFRNSNDFSRGLETAHRDSHAHYQLTYNPSNEILDGKYRRIEVKLAPKGYSVRARRGYYALAQPAGLIGSTEGQMHQALLSPQPVEDLSLVVEPLLFLDAEGRVVTRLNLHLDARGVELTRKGHRYTSALRYAGGIFDASGRLVSGFQSTHPLSLDENGRQLFASQGLSRSADAILPPGTYQIKAVVAEPGGRIGSRRAGLEIPQGSGAKAFLSSLVLADQVEETGTAPAGAPYDPLHLDRLVVVPSGRREFSQQSALTVFFHAYHVSGEEPLKSPYLYQILFFKDRELFNSSRVLPLEGHAAHPQQGLMVAHQFPLADFPPGSYRVQVVVMQEGGKNALQRFTTFTVR